MSKRVKERQIQNNDEEPKMSKEQEAVAKYLRFNCPTSTTMFEGNEVHYFSGNKAVDTLWDSKYGTKNTKNPLFTTRNDVISYISDLHSFQLFFRAKKLVPKKKEEKVDGDSNKSPKAIVEKKKKEEVAETENDEEKVDDEEKKVDAKEEEKSKKKKKVKLLVHSTQVFVDDKDVYVWIFDPTPLFKKVIGVCMLLGTIVGCLFPLWPMWLRQGVYYLSLGGIGFFGAIVVTAILRTILYFIIFAVTMGQHKLWILPNLTEDCGFFESFKPIYTYEYCPRGEKKPKKEKSKKKDKKEKNSDNEEPKEELLEEEKNEGSIGEDFEKVEDEANDSEASSQNASAPSSPEETSVRKRRPVKA